MRWRSFFMRDRNQIKTKKELSSQLFIFSFKEHTQRIKIEKVQGKKTNFCHFLDNFVLFVCSSSRPMKQRIRSERA